MKDFISTGMDGSQGIILKGRPDKLRHSREDQVIERKKNIPEFRIFCPLPCPPHKGEGVRGKIT